MRTTLFARLARLTRLARLARWSLAPAVALALSAGGVAAPAAAASATGTLDASRPASTQAFRTQRVNVNPPAGTYATVRFEQRAGGIYIDFVKLSGIMRATGCVHADLLRNGLAYRTTPTACFTRGTRVVATFQVDAFQAIGTRFVARWAGVAAPAGTESFRVVRS